MAKKKAYGYGKRPVWQWVLIYIVVGAIVYYLIYALFLGNKGGYSMPGSSSTNSAPGY